MSATPGLPLGPVSRRLLAATTEAFDGLVLPTLRQQVPDIVDRVLVTVTSSVAYGTADELSDLDVFIIFRDHRDYVRFAGRVELIVEDLQLGERWPGLCDKGLRFELESLHRADLSRLYAHPDSTRAWHEQAEWLLFWLLNSIPIHDPAGIHRRFRERCSSYPSTVETYRQAAAAFRVGRWARTAGRALRSEGLTYRAIRASMRAATACLDLAYLLAGSLAPHPKWTEALAPRVVAGHASAEDALAAAGHLARVLRDGGTGALLAALEAALRTGRQLLAPDEPADLTLVCREHETADAPSVRVLLPQELWTSLAAPSWRAFLDAGTPVYLPEELGVASAGRRGSTYDRHQRIADGLRWLERQQPDLAPGNLNAGQLPEPARRKRLRYLSFVIWRKLRVIPKAVTRGQPLTATWYVLQVIDHLVELVAAETDEVAPPLDFWSDTTLSFLADHEDLGRLVCEPGAVVPFLQDTNQFCQWAWPVLRNLQRELLERGLLDEPAVADPLSTQMDIQYWRYENLFI